MTVIQIRHYQMSYKGIEARIHSDELLQYSIQWDWCCNFIVHKWQVENNGEEEEVKQKEH